MNQQIRFHFKIKEKFVDGPDPRALKYAINHRPLVDGRRKNIWGATLEECNRNDLDHLNMANEQESFGHHKCISDP